MLTVNFTFQTTVDEQGLTRYCYITDTGLEAPTLHVNPGDQLIINFTNDLPAATPEQMARGMKMPAMQGMKMPMVKAAASSSNAADCPGSGIMTAATTNLHFHGTNVAPICGQDDVIHTMIQPGDTFTYDVQIPSDEPPGLYWYHPHPHGFSEGQVQGGAAGALIVEGIQNVNTSLAGLPAAPVRRPRSSASRFGEQRLEYSCVGYFRQLCADPVPELSASNRTDARPPNRNSGAC